MRTRPLFAWVALCTLMSLTTLLLLRRDPPSFVSPRRAPELEQQPTTLPPASFSPPLASRAHPPEERPRHQAKLDDYLRELEHLSGTDKERALRFADAADTWFPQHGVHAEAREAKRITLLAELGRIDRARTLVRSFLQEHPDSRYRPLVQGVTGIFPRPGAPTP